MRHGLRVENVTKYLDGKKVLNDISVNINPGIILAFVGHSGSGKTTLLKTINRLIEIDKGNIFLNNQSIKEINPIELRQRIGMVFQVPTMFDGTVKQNIEFGLKLHNQNQINRQKITNAIRDTGLTSKFLNKDANKLSGGEQQRVALARTLVLEPDVLLLDEPTAALDPRLTRKIEATILHLCKARNLITLWVTHDHAQARRVGDQLGILRHGKLKVKPNMKTSDKTMNLRKSLMKGGLLY